MALKTCGTCGLEYEGSIVDHAESIEHKALVAKVREWPIEAAAEAGLDCGADYCVDPGNCAKHDAKEVSGDNYARDPEAPKTWDVREEAVLKAVEAARIGERYTFSLTNGMRFDALFSAFDKAAAPYGVRGIYVTDAPGNLGSFLIGGPNMLARIPLFKLDGMTKLITPGPADPQIRIAIERAELAIKVLRGEVEPGSEYGSGPIGAALDAEHLFTIAANTAHLTAAIERGALLRSRTLDTALRGSSEPTGAI